MININDEINLKFEIGIVKELFNMELISRDQMETAIKILNESKQRNKSKLNTAAFENNQ